MLLIKQKFSNNGFNIEWQFKSSNGENFNGWS